MRIGDFLLGQRVDLALPLPPEACAARLRTLVPAHDLPIGHRRLLGRVEGDWVNLHYVGSFLVDRREHARLEARLIAHDGGTRLIGSFRSLTSLVVLVVFHGVILGMAGVMIRDAPAWDAGLAWRLVFPAGFLVAVWAFLFAYAAAADDDWERIHGAIMRVCAE
ncbi:hypothetical protein OF829_02875 [Sphingomonas sp. LB-2]|nr:hypothetical protein [Sphingomonas caeni]